MLNYQQVQNIIDDSGKKIGLSTDNLILRKTHRDLVSHI